MEPSEELTVERVLLEWRKWGQSHSISPEMNVDFDVIKDHLFGSMQLRMTKQILTNQFANDTYEAELVTPRTWWQHWKEAHTTSWYVPAWWLRRYPVQHSVHVAEISVRRMHAYPEAKIKRSDFGRPVIVETIEGPWWR